MEAKPGTNSTDVTCYSLISVVILGVLIVIAVIVLVVYVGIRIRRWHEETTQKTHSEQVLPNATPVAMEETASVFPESDPPADECFRVQMSEHLHGAC